MNNLELEERIRGDSRCGWCSELRTLLSFGVLEFIFTCA